MRLYNEKRRFILDSSHFRYAQLDGSCIRFYNRAPKENTQYDLYCIDFDSPEDAKEKFEELKQEAGWFPITSFEKRALLNTFCFRRFFIKKDGPEGNEHYYLMFWSTPEDFVKIDYGLNYKEALEDLKGLLI